MAEVDRTVGHIGIQEGPKGSLGSFFSEEAAKFRASIEDGTLCGGCEEEIEEDKGVECYCAGEGYSRTHECWKWCSDKCFDNTHEVPLPFPEDWPYDR